MRRMSKGAKRKLRAILRDAGFKRLLKINPRLQTERDEGKDLCEAEIWLIRCLVELREHKRYDKEKKTKVIRYWGKNLEHQYRKLKSIANCLSLNPLPHWAEGYAKVVERMEGGPILNLMKEAEYQKTEWRL